MKRDWTDAIAKRDEEGTCRACGSYFNVQAAHLAPRRYDRQLPGRKVRYVEADNIVPLCGRCHAAFDGYELDLLPTLTLNEQSHVVSVLGLERARRRLTGQREDTPRGGDANAV